MRVVVMGVTGSGKTTVAKAIADARGLAFVDGDDLHPPANVAKMSAGVPLTDDDRWPWLDAVGAWLQEHPDGVVACSALKRAYRDRLRESAAGVVFVHLAAPQSVLTARVERRLVEEGHFAGPDLLASQYAALEQLAFGEPGGVVDVSNAGPADVVEVALEIVDALDV
jgi:carbohydrate kinase (thermoresistant glucokinase family)